MLQLRRPALLGLKKRSIYFSFFGLHLQLITWPEEDV
jgi:hypothetical protein